MNYPDLFNVQFWWIVGLALIVLVPLRHAGRESGHSRGSIWASSS